MKKRVLVVGAVAFDQIFSVHGDISNEIIVTNGKVDKLNMMFTAKNKTQVFGGTGGNIAYGLGILNTNPLLFSVAGKDFKGEYEDHLKKAGVDLRINIDESAWTPTFYGISDEKQQQIGIWQPNVHGDLMDTTPLSATINSAELTEVNIAIFCAGTGRSIFRHIMELREINRDVTIIFDPGQIISVFYDEDLFRNSLLFSDIFISNEVEIKQAETLLGFTTDEIVELVGKYVIETRGADGSIIHTQRQKTIVHAEKVKRVKETTGAGDAYRAGLIYSLINDKSVEEACKFATHVASQSIQHEGPQSYTL